MTGLVRSANIPCLAGCRLAERLRGTMRRPVSVANDADSFAIGEALHGAGRGRRIVFAIVLGSGVGGGLVVDGKLFSGEAGLTGEWGHGPVLLPQDGLDGGLPSFECGCGQRGCLDTVGGARGLERLHQHLHGLRSDSQSIVAAWQKGDDLAVRTIELHVDLLSRFLALIVNLLGVSIIPVGGGLGRVAHLVACLDKAVRQRILRATAEPLVVQAQYPVDAPLIGAALLSRDDASGRGSP